MQLSSSSITVGARGSKLSQAQLWEVYHELQKFHPTVDFQPTFLKTKGDKDLKTSLRDLPKDDFFTKEIDEAQLSGQFRISIHSAKDLPQPLTKGLEIVALTKGVDPRDCLVMRDLVMKDNAVIQKKAIIATSSMRRCEAIQKLYPDCTLVDIRGTIEQRLDKLFSKEVDGVVLARAALIRLQLEHLNHIILDGPVAEFQGQLAIIARCDDQEMKSLFSCIDSRKKVLYTGLEAKTPLIETIPCWTATSFERLHEATHLLFTSKTAVRYFREAIDNKEVVNKTAIAVGRQTENELIKAGFNKIYTSSIETSEGVCELIQTLCLQTATFFWPHSKKSRPVIRNFFQQHNIQLFECILYDTVTRLDITLESLDDKEAIFFSSPSCIDAFLHHYGSFPEGKTLSCQGEVTSEYLQQIILQQKIVERASAL